MVESAAAPALFLAVAMHLGYPGPTRPLERSAMYTGIGSRGYLVCCWSQRAQSRAASEVRRQEVPQWQTSPYSALPVLQVSNSPQELFLSDRDRTSKRPPRGRRYV